MNISYFLDLITRSRLVDEANLCAAMNAIRDDSVKENYEDVSYVACKLIEKKLLTDWHVRQLLNERFRGFFLKKYKILNIIGTGGMSTVYLAEHTIMNRLVAIKVLPRKKLVAGSYFERFLRESQINTRLDHPNVVRVYDIDNAGDVHYIVQEYVDGLTLQRHVEQNGVLPCDKAYMLIQQAAIALQHVHQNGVIHRDIKPGNLLVSSKGIVKIFDFGLALLAEEYGDEKNSTKATGNVVGTADYIAPEQITESQSVDGRADIYSLGGTLYYCLTGKPMFPQGTIPERLRAHQEQKPLCLSQQRSDISERQLAIWRKLVAKKPSERFHTAEDVATQIAYTRIL